MAFGYPVLLELSGRRVVVVGELAVEAGKVEGLLVAGAEVTVVAKGPEAALRRLEHEPRVTVHRRGYAAGDLDGAFLCVAHAAEPDRRAAIATDARAAGTLPGPTPHRPHPPERARGVFAEAGPPGP